MAEGGHGERKKGESRGGREVTIEGGYSGKTLLWTHLKYPEQAGVNISGV